MRFKTTIGNFYITNFFCDEPFRFFVIPATGTLRSNTLGVGATEMTLIGLAIDNILPNEGQVSTGIGLRKPELSTTHACHDYFIAVPWSPNWTIRGLLFFLVGGGRRWASLIAIVVFWVQSGLDIGSISEILIQRYTQWHSAYLWYRVTEMCWKQYWWSRSALVAWGF